MVHNSEVFCSVGRFLFLRPTYVTNGTPNVEESMNIISGTLQENVDTPQIGYVKIPNRSFLVEVSEIHILSNSLTLSFVFLSVYYSC